MEHFCTDMAKRVRSKRMEQNDRVRVCLLTSVTFCLLRSLSCNFYVDLRETSQPNYLHRKRVTCTTIMVMRGDSWFGWLYKHCSRLCCTADGGINRQIRGRTVKWIPFLCLQNLPVPAGTWFRNLHFFIFCICFYVCGHSCTPWLNVATITMSVILCVILFHRLIPCFAMDRMRKIFTASSL